MRIGISSIFYALIAASTLCLPAIAADGVQGFAFGDCDFFAIRDAGFRMNKELLVNPDQQLVDKVMPKGWTPGGVNVFMLKDGKRNFIFDAGVGNVMGDPGRLMAAVTAMGMTPNEIHGVFLTHMHGDHIGGLISQEKGEDGKPLPAFPNADIYVMEKELSYWLSDAEMKKAPEDRQKFFALAKQVADAYGPRIQPFAYGDKINKEPSIIALDAAGHTPGHTVYMVESGGKRVLVWGDLMHMVVVQMPNPDISLVYDMDPVKAAQTRKEWLARSVDEKLRIAGMHMPYPGIGQVAKDGSGFEFLPVK